MNQGEKALFELRADMARDTEPLEDVELVYLLASFEDEADRDLAAVCVLCGLDREMIEERAGILEFDAGLPRIKANRLAITFALQEFDSQITERAARWFFHNAGAALAYGREHGLTDRQIAVELAACFRREFGANATPTVLERAV